MKILFSWVGHADLLGLGCEYPEKRASIQALINKHDFLTPGPIKTAIAGMNFDKIVLLIIHKI